MSVPTKAGQIANAVDANGAVHNLLCGSDAGPQPLQITGVAGDAVVTTPGASVSTTAATLEQGTKAVASAGTPVLLVAAQTLVESVVIQAQKGVATANTGNVYVGFSATPGANLLVLTPGSALNLEAPAGKKIDLHTIYIDAATNADAVAYTSLN